MASTETAACQLYLIVPPESAPEALIAVLDTAETACLMIRRGGLDADALRGRVERLRPPAQSRGVAVLLEDEARLAAALGCDGVHLSDPAAYKDARRILGPDAIVGVSCGASRHAAMVAGEAGADYVAFGALEPAEAPDAELLSWWQALTTVPSVALGATTQEACATLARSGADFVALGNWVWDAPQGSPTAVRAAAKAVLEGANGRSD